MSRRGERRESQWSLHDLLNVMKSTDMMKENLDDSKRAFRRMIKRMVAVRKFCRKVDYKFDPLSFDIYNLMMFLKRKKELYLEMTTGK